MLFFLRAISDKPLAMSARFSRRMPYAIRHKRFSLSAISHKPLAISAFLVLLLACAVPQARVAPARPSGYGTFDLFLNGPSRTPFSLTMTFSSIEAAREDGTSYPVLERTQEIDSLKVVERQILLSEAFLPPGRYRELRVHIARSQVNRSGQVADLSVRPEGYSVNVDFEIKANEATPLFMHWNVADSIERDVFLRPALAFTGRDKELRSVLAYITNENSNTVTVIDRSLDRVIDVLETGSRPRGIVASPDLSKVFVVNSDSNTLTIIDVRTNTVLHRVNLESGANPSDIAIHPNGRTLYIANTALNSVSVMDATSFHTIELVPVDKQPLGLAVDPNGTKVLVANSGANTVSVIDTGTNKVTTTIAVEFQPISVAMDPGGARAFVSHLRSTRMAVISLSSLRIETRVNTGPAAAVLPDVTFRRVFVGLLNQNRLGLFDAAIDAQLATGPVGQEPNRIGLDADRGKLYVVNRGSDNVSVLDKNTLRPRTEIPAGKRPYGIATIR